MQEYEQHMIKAKDGDPTTLEFPNSPNGERILIFYTHDECIFYSNDGQRTIWHPTGEMPLRKKGQGQSIMVSEFLSEVDGPLGVREIIYPGKNCDGYWTGKDVAKQFTKAIMAHKKKYLNYDRLWAFDNSSNHNCFANDALLVTRMNLSSRGQQTLLRDTIINGKKQMMVFPDDYHDEALRGKAKGMKKILKERGLWQEGLLKMCTMCNTNAGNRNMNAGNQNMNADNCSNTCCAQRILELQPDFKAQKSLLEEIAEKEGQKIIFYPKFHCKFNYIEMYWGSAKHYTCENCDYTFRGLQKTVLKALDSISIELIRRFANKSFRYMDAYRLGLTGADAEKAVKKYRSHRRIPESWFMDVRAEGIEHQT